MTPLNARQKVKIQAALCLIHDNGHDAKAVSRAARAFIDRGTQPRAAYNWAFADFSKGKPELTRALAHTGRLIDASDMLTVARYGDALERYNQTGDPSAMAGIAQTFVQDSIALAVKNGELAAEDAANPEAVHAAFGFTLGGGAGDRIVAMAGAPEAAPAETPETPATAMSQNAQAPAAERPASPSAEARNGPQSGYAGQGGFSRAVTMTGKASFQPIDRQSAASGSGQVIEKQGWSPSDTYG